MVRVEERVAHLEGQMNELSQDSWSCRVRSVTSSNASMRGSMQSTGNSTRSDARFDAVGRRFDALDDKVSRQFVWVVGIIVTTLVAMVGAVLSRG